MTDMAAPLVRPFSLAGLAPEGETVTIETSAEERAALARSYGVEAVNAFAAEMTVTPWRAIGWRVRGRVRADITQTCVVTLEPLEAVVDEPIEATFLPAGSDALLREPGVRGEEIVDPEAEDAPEAVEGGVIDLGALAAEHFALGIDPYPRKPGAVFEPPASEEDRASPFAALAQLRQGKARESGDDDA